MDEHVRHRVIWNLLQPLARLWIPFRFRLECEPIREKGPMLLIVNHVTAWDPLFMALAMGRKQIYYVASEHILRAGFAGKLIKWLVAPIARRKGAASLGTVKECLRHLRSGHSVCLFAEGEQSWDGRSIPVVKGTGSLAQAAGVQVVTYRLEGGYLSLPRWGKGLRRGRIRGRVTGVYSPALLGGLAKEDINRLLNKSIQENAWERQRQEKARYMGKRPAESLERLLYLCPGCGCVGTLQSRGDQLFCPCGLRLTYTDTGFFSPDVPFADLSEWEDWQREQLHRRRFVCAEKGGCLFSDEAIELMRIGEGHTQTLLGTGHLAQYEDRLECAGHCFSLDDIPDMAMTQANRLLFTGADGYYQLRALNGANLRKYLEIWKEAQS